MDSWRETAGYYTSEYFDWFIILVLAAAAIITLRDIWRYYDEKKKDSGS